DVVELNIMILQHGLTPADYEGVTVTATHAESAKTIEVEAVATVETGTYQAEITFDAPGRWKIRGDIASFGIGAAFPTVYVHTNKADLDAETVSKGSDVDAVVEVNIISGTFDPPLTTVTTGSTVRFTNMDGIKHEVAFADSAIDDSGILEPGESFEVTFDAVGEFLFVCGPHPGMSGSIEVEE
ncbi:MAG: cupredoxin domain-containing protein, partial [Thermomicrobiales bacterium]|nr:cupredoxin domain-containing protein [Thermomicrobiales bacterium]